LLHQRTNGLLVPIMAMVFVSMSTLPNLVMSWSGLVRFSSKFSEPGTRLRVQFNACPEPWTGPSVQVHTGPVQVQQG
jgi:hypothetical protein